MKKAISIMLVLIMVCAIFIVPAHAQESGEVTPRYRVCANCGGALVYKTELDYKTYYDYPGCTNNAMTHKHYDATYITYYECTACDSIFNEGSYTVKNVCIYD